MLALSLFHSVTSTWKHTGLKPSGWTPTQRPGLFVYVPLICLFVFRGNDLLIYAFDFIILSLGELSSWYNNPWMQIARHNYSCPAESFSLVFRFPNNALTPKGILSIWKMGCWILIHCSWTINLTALSLYAMTQKCDMHFWIPFSVWNLHWYILAHQKEMFANHILLSFLINCLHY
jgi:hypothetical protein